MEVDMFHSYIIIENDPFSKKKKNQKFEAREQL